MMGLEDLPAIPGAHALEDRRERLLHVCRGDELQRAQAAKRSRHAASAKKSCESDQIGARQFSNF